VHLLHGLFYPEHRILLFYRSYIAVFTHQAMLALTQPLAPYYPLFTYLENQLLCLWCKYPSTLVPGLLTTTPPFASSPTLSQVKLQYASWKLSPPGNFSENISHWYDFGPEKGQLFVQPFWLLLGGVALPVRISCNLLSVNSTRFLRYWLLYIFSTHSLVFTFF
jgi:hypothetical protein